MNLLQKGQAFKAHGYQLIQATWPLVSPIQHYR